MSPLTGEGKDWILSNAMSVKPSGYKKIQQLLDNSFHVCETTGQRALPNIVTQRIMSPKKN